MDPRRRLGELGEDEAARHLARLGHDLLDRNFRTRYGELDLVTRVPECLVFCEVKTRIAGGRTGPSTGLDAIGPAKQRRLRLMAREWLRLRAAGHGILPQGMRFDAVGVLFDARGRLLALDHVEDAF